MEVAGAITKARRTVDRTEWERSLELRYLEFREQEAKKEQEIATRENAASAKWLGPDAAAGRLFDVMELMKALITCHDANVLQRAMRVCRHALDPIQKDLEAERLQKYYQEAYGTTSKFEGTATDF